MNNVVYVDFNRREVVQLVKLWAEVSQLSNIIDSELNFNQYNKLMGTTKYIDRAHKVKKLTKSTKILKKADKMIELIKTIESTKRIA